MTQSFYEKVTNLKNYFSDCASKKEIYQKIIHLGEKLTPFSDEHKIPANKVSGCQSEVYMHAEWINGKVIFSATSDALISAGLVYLLISVYSKESPQIILLEKPNYLQELKIPHALSMNRSNGLYQMYNHMQKQTLFLAKISL